MNTQKKVNRGWLKRRIIAGQVVGICTNSGRCAYNGLPEPQGKIWDQVVIGAPGSVPGALCIWEDNFRGLGQAYWDDNEIILSVPGEGFRLRII